MPTSATAPWAADLYGKLSAWLPWISTRSFGMSLIAAACPDIQLYNNQYGMVARPAAKPWAMECWPDLVPESTPSRCCRKGGRIQSSGSYRCNKRKKKLLEENKGPVLLDTITYRFSGHSPSDASTYRTKEEIEAWQEMDSIPSFRNELIKAKVAKDDQFDEIIENTRKSLTRYSSCPSMTMYHPESIWMSTRTELLISCSPMKRSKRWRTGNPRFSFQRKIPELSRSAEDTHRLPGRQACISYRVFSLDAIFEALIDRFYIDPTRSPTVKT